MTSSNFYGMSIDDLVKTVESAAMALWAKLDGGAYSDHAYNIVSAVDRLKAEFVKAGLKAQHGSDNGSVATSVSPSSNMSGPSLLLTSAFLPREVRHTHALC